MSRDDHEAIKRLLDICWQIHRANLEGGDIAAGQLLDCEFDNALEMATRVFGRMVIDN